jgi:DNA-binding LytR/AlgR family response regulator
MIGRPADSRFASRSGKRGEDGFATVDALVALVILATTLAWSMVGLQSAARLAQRANDLANVTVLAKQLFARPGDGVSASAGVAGPYRWRFSEEAGAPASGPCLRTLMVRNTRLGRQYRFSGAGPCA